MGQKLKRLVYRSTSLIDHEDTAALDELFRVSQTHNRRDRITGAMALPDRTFVQVIEGLPRDVDVLMARIRADRRHDNIVVLGEWSATARLFPGWAMARPDLRPLNEQAFRIATQDGNGVQVTGILLGMVEKSVGDWH